MKFSSRSLGHLVGVHPTLVRLLSEVTEHFDCSILDGVRTVEEQKQNVARGLSKTMNSKHLMQEDGFGHAVDVAPTPIRWDLDVPSGLGKYDVQCLAFLFYLKGYAKGQGIDLRIGADWNGNNLWNEMDKSQSFNDLVHVELPVNPKNVEILKSLDKGEGDE
jgi:hypothetical protein